jgi:hypothetical protein
MTSGRRSPLTPPPPPPSYYVGIIPETGAACPNGNQRSVIHLDTEDSEGLFNYRFTAEQGWIGASKVDNDMNVDLVFCRVDGSKLKPLTATADPSKYYAVLKLDAKCPPGSVEFKRYFDGEDNDDNPWTSGYVSPNGYDSNGNVTLYFCLFRSGAATMSEFPSYGLPYGVFAAYPFAKKIRSGRIRVEDESDHNISTLTAATADVVADAKKIVKPFETRWSTVLRVAQVHPGPALTPPPPRATYDVGVLQAVAVSGGQGRNVACKPYVWGADYGTVVQFQMDTLEAGTSHSGWTGTSSTGPALTNVNVCRMDGTQVKPLTATTATSQQYAVLKLDDECPPGSIEFSRYFDNDDSVYVGPYNQNWYGDIRPNTMTENTHLYFCLFRGGPVTMAEFPDVGFPYGVFAPEDFVPALERGTITIDDEDDSYRSRLYAPSLEEYFDVLRIVSDNAYGGIDFLDNVVPHTPFADVYPEYDTRIGVARVGEREC